MAAPTQQHADTPISDELRGWPSLWLAPVLGLWHWLALQGKLARHSLFFVSLTGLVLFAPLALPWIVARHALLLHIVAGLVVLPVAVLPFWLRHRERMLGAPRSFQRSAGRALELLLLAEIVSGLYLFFPGNPGHQVGELTSWAHLLLAVPFLAYMLTHGGPVNEFRKRRRLARLLAQSGGSDPSIERKRVS